MLKYLQCLSVWEGLITFFSKTWFTAAMDVCAPGRHDCAQVCRRNGGSYSCDCFEGFTLNPDKKTCSGKTWPRKNSVQLKTRTFLSQVNIHYFSDSYSGVSVQLLKAQYNFSIFLHISRNNLRLLTLDTLTNPCLQPQEIPKEISPISSYLSHLKEANSLIFLPA